MQKKLEIVDTTPYIGIQVLIGENIDKITYMLYLVMCKILILHLEFCICLRKCNSTLCTAL